MSRNYSDKLEGGAGTIEARREALKQFSRYVAAAPAAMLLLEPHESHAAQRRGKSGKNEKNGKNGNSSQSGNASPRAGGYH